MKRKPWCPIAKGLPPESNLCLCDDDRSRRDRPSPPDPSRPDIDRYFFEPFDYEFAPPIGKQMKWVPEDA
jgi:hypothetical protein